MNHSTQLRSHSFRQHMLGRYPPSRSPFAAAVLPRINRPSPAPRSAPEPAANRAAGHAASNGK